MTALNIRSLNKKSQRKSDLESKSEKSEALSKVGVGTNRHSETKKQLIQKPKRKNNSSVQLDREGNREENREAKKKSESLFQAVGVIQGEVSFADEAKPTITLDGKQYLLIPQSNFKEKSIPRKLRKLRNHIEATGNNIQRLLVYPYFNHCADGFEPVSFQMIRFSQNIGETITNLLEDRDFSLCGLWQFIPSCELPCISIFKNATFRNTKSMEKASCVNRVKFLEPCHIPLLWENPSVQPFHYDPQLNQLDQDVPMFIRVKTKFIPQRNHFEFDSELGKPLEQPPAFLQATEEDRKIAEKEIRQEELKNTQQKTASLFTYEDGLTAVALAKRLGVSDSTVSQQSRKGEDKFAVWSRNKDPDGLAWQRCEITGKTSKGKLKPRYFPLLN